jgi:hypothetical protein
MITGYCAHSQNLVGMTGNDIQKYMKENRLDMSFENVTNDSFRYLKYSNNSGNQTILFFFEKDSVCKSIRLICDTAMKTEKVKEYDSLYTRSGENKWIENREGKNYLVELKDEEWSCIVTIKADN